MPAERMRLTAKEVERLRRRSDVKSIALVRRVGYDVGDEGWFYDVEFFPVPLDHEVET